MNRELQKLMLSECRCVTYRQGSRELSGAGTAEVVEKENGVSEEGLVKALTVNENLLTLGYTLKPADLAKLADSPSMETFYEEVKGLMGDVAAAPMYPDFPTQVMEMDEAKFRFHQMLHYLSTYGLETYLGEKVSRGWLPYEDSPKEEADTILLEAKVLELLEEEEAAAILAQRILVRRERMTLPEKELVRLALEEIAPAELERFEIPFKENLTDIFLSVMEHCEKEQAFAILRALCRHTGDVLRCVSVCLRRWRFHLRTAQKRFLVKLLESYPVVDFKANLILSRKKAGESLRVLQYLDYNIYSRSDAHREAVRALRDGELRSWEGQARYLLENHEDGALEFVAARPGMMLRMVAWLLRLGYTPEDVREKMVAGAEDLSSQTLVTTLTYFGDQAVRDQRMEALKQKLLGTIGQTVDTEAAREALSELEDRRKEMEQVYGILQAALEANLRGKETPLRGRKIFVDMGQYDLERSILKCNDKSAEGGYVRSGIAYRIPEEVNHLRFFVYWNDEERVDVDLHAAAFTLDGQKIEIGWNADYKEAGIVSSGDITHSDAAEYIDADLTAPLKEIGFNINLYYGKRSFGEIETCYVGLMAVDKLGTEIKLYNLANCFFSHELRGKCHRMQYGYVDVVNRCLVFDGNDSDEGYYDYKAHAGNSFSLQGYLDMLLAAQEATTVETEEEADIVLKMGKAESEREISFLDSNFFL